MNIRTFLEILEVNHHSGTAVSLIERQVESLRSSNEDMKKQLNRLVQVASENEELMSRLHQLTLELMSISSRQEFFTHLGNSLLNDFNADILQIFLLDKDTASVAGDDVIGIQADDPALEQFKALLRKAIRCADAWPRASWSSCSAAKARWVQSTALTPLGEMGCDGMMAIGSSDPDRFYPGMGTLFLDLLANVISPAWPMKSPRNSAALPDHASAATIPGLPAS